MIFKDDAEFIEKLIQPVSALALRIEAVGELPGEPVVIMTKEDFEALKSTFESIKRLAVARRDQLLKEAS